MPDFASYFISNFSSLTFLTADSMLCSKDCQVEAVGLVRTKYCSSHFQVIFNIYFEITNYSINSKF